MKKSGIKGGRSVLFAFFGFLLGVFAPIGWIFLQLLFFRQSHLSFLEQIAGAIFDSPQSMALYTYMGGGTAAVLGIVGWVLGKGAQQLHERAQGLDRLNKVVAQQKEEFERRFLELNRSIKNFHSINAHIQKSTETEEVLRLSADGLHDILGYDRVNILMQDSSGNNLDFVSSRGSDNDSRGVSIPLDERAGVMYKVWQDKRALLVDDIEKMPSEYRVKPPASLVPQIRSSSFILSPIVVCGQVVGLLAVDNKLKKKPLGDTDLDTVRLFADQVSSSLTRINLLNGVETLIRELEHTFAELIKYRDQFARNNVSLTSATTATSDAIGDISRAADVVEEMVDATRSASGEISVSIEEVSRNLNQLTDFIDHSISATNEISRTIVGVQESAVRSHCMSEQVKEQAEKGVASVTNTLGMLRGISEAVERAVGAIGKLSEKGEEVNSITTVINEITQKTNLLALNASIIAAQAGEHGRSFAVVADEVRSLSQEAAYSTGAIAQIIDEIQAFTQETVDQIGATRNLVRDGIELGEGMEGSLRQILDSAALAMDMAHSIRKATQEVATSVESVSISIEELGEMSAHVSLASSEQAQGTRSIVRSIEEVKKMSEEMVSATEKQENNIREIEKAVDAVSEMAQKIFREMEERKDGSREVIQQLEWLKRIEKN